MKLSDFIKGGAGAVSGELKMFAPANGVTPEGYTRASGIVAPTGLYEQVRFITRPNNVGFTATSQNKAWTVSQVFDINTGALTSIASAPANSVNTAGGMIANDDGFITFGGGGTFPGNVTMRYTASSNSWSQLTNMPGIRLQSCLAELPDGQILVFGGVNSSTVAASSFTNTVFRFNPATNSWATLSAMPFRSYSGKAARLPDGRIGIFFPSSTTSADGLGALGGTRLFIYNPVDESWTEMDAPSTVHGTGSMPYVLADGRLVIVSSTTASSQVLDPAATPGSQWSSYPITSPGGGNVSFASALNFSKPMLGAFLPCTSTIGLLLWTGATPANAGTAFYATKD